MVKTERYIGLDLVRMVAVMSVIAVHFSLNSKFYTNPLGGVGMFFQEYLRVFFMSCVPLFLMLTGFLNGKKVFSLEYYKGIWKIIESYLLFSVVAILFRVFYVKESYSFGEWIVKVVRFNADEYGWYVEMYVGLFMIIPFLNILYHNIVNKRQKEIFIGILMLMTVNTNRLLGYDILPAFWKGLYPITYFFIGMYIKEFLPKIDKKIGVLLILVLMFLGGMISLYLKESLVYFYFNSPIVMGIAILLFLLLYEFDFDNRLLRWVVSNVSMLSLDIYLVSYIFDKIFYAYFLERYFYSQEQFYYYFPILFLLVLSFSFVSAFIKSKVRDLIVNR
jgi:surface polysaccharide O-acyltransferase-like enzyme